MLSQEVIFRLLQYVYYMIMGEWCRMKYSSMGNLRDKKGKFTSRKQLANGESILCSCCSFFNIMIVLVQNLIWLKLKLSRLR